LKRLLKVLNVVLTVALVGVVLSTIFLAISARRSSDSIPTVSGNKVLTVLSGSMEPKIHTGDVIIVKPLLASDEVREGDIITFRTQEKADMLITHRVVGVVSVNGKAAAYVTKGDSNDSQDLSTVGRDQLVGRYSWRVPYFGYVASFLRKPVGIVLVIILPGLFVIGTEVRKMWLLLAEAETAAAKGGDPPKA
jgi:signal peptidase